jgi:hypothetical protein
VNAAQRHTLAALGVKAERIYVDHGLTGTNRCPTRAARVPRWSSGVEAGIGKTALLHYCGRQAAGCRVARLAGVTTPVARDPARDVDGRDPAPRRATLYRSTTWCRAVSPTSEDVSWGTWLRTCSTPQPSTAAARRCEWATSS